MAVLQEMNPLVSVSAAPGSATAVREAPWVAQFQVVLLVGGSLALMQARCR